MANFENHSYDDSFIDLRIYQSGSQQCPPAHSFGPARREHYLFHYVLSGEGTLYGSDKDGSLQTHRVHAGQGFLIYPDQVNTYVADAKSPWEYVWIEFDGLRVKENLDITDLSWREPVYQAKSDKMREEMVQEMHYIVQHWNSPVLHTVGHLYLFFDYFTRSAESACQSLNRRVRDDYVRIAVDHIEKHFHESLRVEDLATLCGINRSYFGKLFHEAVGKSPRAFLMDYRMMQAARLLRTTDLPVSEIARRVGYDNPLHFSRAFKKVEGLSPSDWRAVNRP